MSRSARPWLAPLAPLYRLALAAREFGLRTGLETVRRLPWPVVSVGSLSAGGAGKTPLTIALARALSQGGTFLGANRSISCLSIAVLSRGYGRSSAAPARVDPDGSADEFGDEPLEIAQATGLAVYVAADRYQAGLLAEREAEEPQRRSFAVHLLDDGFQHRRLHRDVDIVLVSRHGLDDRLLPAGNLREPLSALRRATILAVPAEDAGLASELHWKGPVWHLHRRMEVPLVSSPVAAFCGIARPEQFFAGLESAGISLAARLAFPDHRRYTAADLARIRSAAQTAGAAALLTTEKDRVRLGPLAAQLAEAIPLDIARLHVAIEDEEAALLELANLIP